MPRGKRVHGLRPALRRPRRALRHLPRHQPPVRARRRGLRRAGRSQLHGHTGVPRVCGQHGLRRQQGAGSHPLADVCVSRARSNGARATRPVLPPRPPARCWERVGGCVSRPVSWLIRRLPFLAGRACARPRLWLRCALASSREGSASVDANHDWTAYAKPGGKPPPSPKPDPPGGSTGGIRPDGAPASPPPPRARCPRAAWARHKAVGLGAAVTSDVCALGYVAAGRRRSANIRQPASCACYPRLCGLWRVLTKPVPLRGITHRPYAPLPGRARLRHAQGFAQVRAAPLPGARFLSRGGRRPPARSAWLRW